MASKNDIAALVKKTDFDDKLKHLNENVTSNKNELNELSKKVKAIPNKRINKRFEQNIFLQEYFKIV